MSYKRFEIIGFIMLVLCLVFWLSDYSLTGIWPDILFWYITIFVNILCLILLFQNRGKINYPIIRKIIWIITLTLNFIVFIIFPFSGYYSTKLLYNPEITKYNLYSQLFLKVRKAYFLETNDMCYDGVYWETETFYYLPIIEHKTKENECYKLEDLDILR